MKIIEAGDFVKHKSGVELKVLRINTTVSTCEYVHEKDYIHSKFMAMNSVIKIAIVLTDNLLLDDTNKVNQLTLF
jgi:hypothetical protein